MKPEQNFPHSDLTLKRRIEDLSRIVGGEIEFGSPEAGAINIQGVWVKLLTPGVANTEFIINHNLGYIPTGIIVISVDNAAVIYASRLTLWTKTQAFFKSSQASTNLVAFVI